MELGAFSVSLSVTDMDKSQAFYRKLGFEVIGGEQSPNWLVLRNGDHNIGLFQGMCEGNIMTFNPGWDKSCNTLDAPYMSVGMTPLVKLNTLILVH